MTNELNDLIIPRHISLILDGNGRWAKQRFLPRKLGHKAGSENLEKILEYSVKIGLKYLSVYAFSTENWKRSEEEVSALMSLFKHYMVKLLGIAKKNNIKVLMIGDKRKFDKDIINGINTLVEETKNNTGLCFIFAVNYGARDEIKRAIQNIIKDNKKEDEISEELISSYLDTKDIPDPDLLIRTSGEFRLSNFLLWQIAYTEIFISNLLWPDFNEEELIKAIKSYNQRERRFGGR